MAQTSTTPCTVGAKLSNDSAIQMLRMPGPSLSSAEHKVDDFYTKIKVALAYAETRYSRSVQFMDEIVEPDSGRMGVAKTAEQKIHLGRTLVLKEVDRQSIAKHCVQARHRHGSRVQG